MCDICTRVRSVMKAGNTAENQKEALEVINRGIQFRIVAMGKARGQKMTPCMNAVMDEVLGTGLQDEDQEKASAWERSRRG